MSVAPRAARPGGGTRRISQQAAAAAGLLSVAAVWGSTFFMLKGVIERVPIPDVLAMRFAFAAAVLWLLRPRAVAVLPARARRAGVALGLVYGVAQLLQTAGLAHTSASVSGFVTGMYVVFTPLLGAAVLRLRIAPAVWLAVGLATLGLGLLSLRGFAIGYGEALTLASAALYAVHILGLGAVMGSFAREAYGLSVVQMLTIGAVCGVAAAPGGVALPDRPGDWAALVYMALVAGALALVVQTWAQAHLPPTRAAVIMTMEPVWASVFAVGFGGERLGWRTVAGGGLVLAAMYLCELGPRRRTEPPDVDTAGEVGGVPHVGPV